MPIIGATVNLEYKLLPLTLNADGTSIVYLRKGFTVNGVFQTVETIEGVFNQTETMSILLGTPTPGKDRLNDFSDAMYALFVSKGLASGVIA
jgi:hypothetical protein